MKNVEKKSSDLSPTVLYSRFTGRKVLFISVGVALLMVVALIAASLGGASLGIGDVLRALIAGPPSHGAENSINRVIVWYLRLPRIVMAIIAGAGLATAGVAMQGALKNPLVSPFTVGVASGATLGASLAIVLGFSLIGIGRYVVIGNAFAFAMITSFLIVAIGRLRGITPESFILVGIALTYFFSAFTSLLQYVATEGELSRVVHWSFGSLNGLSWGNVGITSVVMLISFPLLLKYSWDLNAMAQGGDEFARSLGVNCGRVRIMSMVLASLITASTTCFTGIIGFVGLIAPHITRLLIGGDHRYLFPASAVVGAILLLTADTIGRTIISPIIIPVGIVLSFIGAPFFFYLLIKRRRQYWQ